MEILNGTALLCILCQNSRIPLNFRNLKTFTFSNLLNVKLKNVSAGKFPGVGVPSARKQEDFEEEQNPRCLFLRPSFKE